MLSTIVSVLLFMQCIHRCNGSYSRYQHQNDDGWIIVNEDDQLHDFIEDWHNEDSWDKQQSITIIDGRTIHMKCFSISNEETCGCKSGASQPIHYFYTHPSLGTLY